MNRFSSRIVRVGLALALALIAPMMGTTTVQRALHNVCATMIAQPVVTAQESEEQNVNWRRTAKGWEPSAAWVDAGPDLAPPPAAANLHPTVVAMLQMLISVGALISYEHTDEDESTDLIHMLT